MLYTYSGHCKSMKPDWDKLGDKYWTSDSIIIGDVDCTVEENDPLCDKYDVDGYPTIMTFNEDNPMGEDYPGPRSYEKLLEHVETNMGPACGCVMRVCRAARSLACSPIRLCTSLHDPPCPHTVAASRRPCVH